LEVARVTMVEEPEGAPPMNLRAGAVLRRSREASHLTQRYVAARLGFDPRTLSLWERGIGQPSDECLVRLAELYQDPKRILAYRLAIGAGESADASYLAILYDEAIDESFGRLVGAIFAVDESDAAATCAAKLSSGKSCERMVSQGETLCTVHRRWAERPQCSALRVDGQRCRAVAVSGDRLYCSFHRARSRSCSWVMRGGRLCGAAVFGAPSQVYCRKHAEKWTDRVWREWTKNKRR
jgi:transcriptional regulator with XRE-family HTH domain